MLMLSKSSLLKDRNTTMKQRHRKIDLLPTALLHEEGR